MLHSGPSKWDVKNIAWKHLYGLKTKEGLFISLVRPDFNVLPLIQRHFKARYQDQEWLIYDENATTVFITI